MRLTPFLLPVPWLLRVLLPVVCMVSGALAQQPQVSAELEPNPIAPNQLATFTITLDNANPSGVPELRLPQGWATGGNVSRQNEISFVNGVQSITVRFSWSVTCTQEGTYTFPPQEVPVGQRHLTTNEVQVEVKAGAQAPKPGGPNQDQNNGLGKLEPILQLHMAKTEFYQGEIVPVNATLYLPRSLQLRRLGLIEVEKQDLAIQRFPQQAEQSLETVGGRPYFAFSFRSSLSALKAGKMKVGPAKTDLIVDVPIGNRGFPFGLAPSEERKVTVKGLEIPITVLALPAEGKPPGFSGAVGDFSMVAAASMTEVSVGEPLAVDVMIQGQGNFDAIEPPKLSNSTNWKTYPPKRYNVDTGDPNTADLMNRKLGFNCILVPDKVMTEIPAFEFSFFSPRTKQYVHLRSQPIPIVIKGPATPVAAETAGSTSTPPAPPAPGDVPVPAPKADISDILMPVPAQAYFVQGTTPLFSDPRFTVANVVLLIAFLSLVGWTWWRRVQEERKDSPVFALRQLWNELAKPGLGEAEFYRRAVHYIVQASPGAPPESTRPIFAAYEELNFKSTAAGAQPVDAARRAEVLALLKPLAAKAEAARAPSSTAGAVAALLVLGIAGMAQASPQEQYQAVAQAVEKGDYKAAQKMGETMVREGNIGPELFTLLGHAMYKQGQPGIAAMWYQRAQVFPSSPSELRQNLLHIEEKIHFFERIRLEWVERWGLLLSRNAWLILSVAGLWTAIFGVGILFGAGQPSSRFIGSRKALMGWAGAAVVVGFLVVTLGLVGYFVRPNIQSLKNYAFVTAPKAQAHTGATQVSGTVILVPPGSVVQVLNTRGSWSYVEIPTPNDMLRGWLPTGQIEPWWPFDANKLP